MIKCASKNILESSSVSLGAGVEDPSYPLYRLYDRAAGRAFRPAGAGAVEIIIDQGSDAPLPVDRMFIPPGHNLDGMTLGIEHSEDGATYTYAISPWPAASGLIEKSWTPLARRYWKFTIESGSTLPELSELFITQTYEWEKDPPRPAGPFDPEFNVEHSQTASGADRFLVSGQRKRRRRYSMPACNKAQKDNIEAVFSDWAGSRPFWLCDHEGNWMFGRLAGPLNLREVAHQTYSFDFDFVEVLS